MGYVGETGMGSNPGVSFQSRVENWQRWARGHAGLRPIQAESLERLYRSLNWGDLADGPPTALEALRGAVDVLDAQVIEDAWRTLPEPYKGFLKGAWIKAEHHRKTCRLNGVHWRQYDETLMLAMLMLRDLVELETA